MSKVSLSPGWNLGQIIWRRTRKSRRDHL